MHLRTQSYNAHHLVIAEGIMDGKAFEEIRKHVQALPDHQAKHVWIDCGSFMQLVTMNGSFSGFLNQLLALKAMQVEVSLYGLDDTGRRLLRLLKLDHLFQLACTVDEAYLPPLSKASA